MKKYLMLLMAGMLLFVTACGKSKDSVAIVENQNENSIYIYYPVADGIETHDDMYQIKQPDSLSAAVEETMAAIAVDAWNESITYHTYMLDADNNLSLDFYASEMPDTKNKLLASAAICQTLFQLSDINSITLRVFSDEEEMILEDTYHRESFYFYGYEDSVLNNREITLYYPNKSGDYLMASKVTIREEINKTIPEQIVGLLTSRGVVPSGTKVNSVYFGSGVCYLDLSKAFVESMASANGKMIIYSLVNSITDFNGVDAVYVLVDGEPIASYRGFEGTNQALSFDETIVK